MQSRFDASKYETNKNDDDEGKGRSGGEKGDDDDGTPRLNLCKKAPEQEMEEITRKLNFRRGNTTELSPNNTPELNSSIIARQNAEKFQNRQIREREKEIRKIQK